MKVLNEKELINISGGLISGTLINSILKGINIIVDLGRSLGTAIRRLQLNSFCKL